VDRVGVMGVDQLLGRHVSKLLERTGSIGFSLGRRSLRAS
jgi:hypothetical protein